MDDPEFIKNPDYCLPTTTLPWPHLKRNIKWSKKSSCNLSSCNYWNVNQSV